MAYKSSLARNTWKKVAHAFGGDSQQWQSANPEINPPYPPARTLKSPFVNVNTALAAQLVSLPGIGAVKARAIVKHRKKHGRFKKSEHLIDVKGIGKKTHAGLKRHVKLSG